MENMSLDNIVLYHFPRGNISVIPGPPPSIMLSQMAKTTITPSSITIIMFLFIFVTLLPEAHTAFGFFVTPFCWITLLLQVGLVWSGRYIHDHELLCKRSLQC